MSQTLQSFSGEGEEQRGKITFARRRDGRTGVLVTRCVGGSPRVGR